MWNESEIEEYLKNNLETHRYKHSLSVRDTAMELCKIYDEDIEKAKIAALVHDCAKNMSDKELLSILDKYNYKVDDIYRKSPQLCHGLVGAIIAEKTMGIVDKDILNAITFHTTGRENMSLLEKIIYISDYVEPFRSFPGVDEMRDVVRIDIDKALLMSFDNTIRFILSKGQLLHMDTVAARNYTLYTINNR